MRIVDIPHLLDLARASRICPMLWGHRGIGKSQSLQEYCTAREIGLVDLRLATKLPEELRGYPVAKDDYMIYLPPGELPHAEKHGEKGILFLDELPRADRAVIDAAFCLVYDQRIGDYVLPPGWFVVAAGNPQGDVAYVQPGMTDAAFLDRFCHIRMNADDAYVNDWIRFVTAQPDLDQKDVEKVVSMVAFSPKYLMNSGSVDLGFEVTPTPRSWSATLRVLTAGRALGTPPHVVLETIAGLVGDAVAQTFSSFKLSITPDDIVSGRKKEADWDKLKDGEQGRKELVALLTAIGSREPSWLKEKVMGERLCAFLVWLVKGGRERDLIARLMVEQTKWGEWIAQYQELSVLAARVALGMKLTP